MFWRGSISWLIKHREELSDQESAMVLEWASDLYWRSVWQTEMPFCLNNWSVEEATRSSRCRFEEPTRYAESFIHLHWPGNDWNWDVKDENNQIWSFRELTSGTELLDFGRAVICNLAHYAFRCAQRLCAAFLLQRSDRQAVILFIEMETMGVSISCGCYDEAPDSGLQWAVDKWLSSVVSPQRQLAKNPKNLLGWLHQIESPNDFEDDY